MKMYVRIQLHLLYFFMYYIHIHIISIYWIPFHNILVRRCILHSLSFCVYPNRIITTSTFISSIHHPPSDWTASKQLILIVHPSTNTSRKLTYASIRRGMRWSEERQLPSTIFPNICKGIRLRESSQSSFDSGSDWRLGEGQRLPMSMWWGWWIWDFGGRKGLCTWMSTLIS